MLLTLLDQMRFGFDLLTGGLPCLLAAALGSQVVHLYYQPLRVQYGVFITKLLFFHYKFILKYANFLY